MIATILSYTTIHVGGTGPEQAPYAVILARGADGSSLAGRADGDLNWVAIGASVEFEEDGDGVPRARPAG
jgi:uncharacterized OB-fold protein